MNELVRLRLTEPATTKKAADLQGKSSLEFESAYKSTRITFGRIACGWR
jgi:hypothetical protein